MSAVSHLYRGFLHVDRFGNFPPAHLFHQPVSVYCPDGGIPDGPELVPDNPLCLLMFFLCFFNVLPESFAVDSFTGCGIGVSTAAAYAVV